MFSVQMRKIFFGGHSLMTSKIIIFSDSLSLSLCFFFYIEVSLNLRPLHYWSSLVNDPFSQYLIIFSLICIKAERIFCIFAWSGMVVINCLRCGMDYCNKLCMFWFFALIFMGFYEWSLWKWNKFVHFCD